MKQIFHQHMKEAVLFDDVVISQNQSESVKHALSSQHNASLYIFKCLVYKKCPILHEIGFSWRQYQALLC